MPERKTNMPLKKVKKFKKNGVLYTLSERNSNQHFSVDAEKKILCVYERLTDGSFGRYRNEAIIQKYKDAEEVIRKCDQYVAEIVKKEQGKEAV